MQLRPDIQIKSILKSMTDVVLPAIDPNNKLAQEQAQLMMGMLKLMRSRLPLEYRFDRDELKRLLDLSQRLCTEARGGSRTTDAVELLTTSVTRGAEALDRARCEPAELYEAVKELRSKVGNVVQSVFSDGEKLSRAVVHKSVMATSAEQLLRDRAWLIEQGWEPDPASIPPIETLLAQ